MSVGELLNRISFNAHTGIRVVDVSQFFVIGNSPVH